ncbi:hypothetical protein [Aequorivita capsosiphonis]|uniref:hypothetical protein n=1 Tax=Aequorivita capsosiphonis TaxID=487317 RepID=UPI000412EEA7|nr:hypothetical protein [Aequorivita capsosiphonis]
MAEIKIKKKEPIWPWILGLLLIGAIVYFLVFADDSTDDVDDVTTTKTEQPMNQDEMDNSNDLKNVSEINDYNIYVSNPDMDVDHEYSSEALKRLIAATSATANELQIDIDADMSAANSLANEIKKDPESLMHANKIKDAAHKITKALKTIQTEKFPQLTSQYTEVETAVSNINVDTPTLDQKSALKAFFNKAGNLLTSIQNNDGQSQ